MIVTSRRILPWVWVTLVGGTFLGELAVDLSGDITAGAVNVYGTRE